MILSSREESPLTLKSGPNSLELTQASQVKGMFLPKTALYSETSSQSQGPQATLTRVASDAMTRSPGMASGGSGSGN